MRGYNELNEEERKEHRREYQRRWYQKNKEEINRKRRERYQENKEKYKLRAKEYREKNKEYYRQYGRNYYHKNKEEHNKYHREWWYKCKEEWIKLLGGKCMHCGNDNKIVLDFHHIDLNKKEGSPDRRNKKEFRKAIEEQEIMLLCANCHREEHYNIKMGEREGLK